MFNLPPPPNFCGLDEHKPLAVYHRHLPHWRQEGATYFVTFRLADALPQDKVRLLKGLRKEWERTHAPPRSEKEWEEHVRDIARRTEAWLDEGHGACYFRQDVFASQLQAALMHFQEQRYFLSCWVIMANHCHLLIRPYDGWELEKVLQGMKGVVAHHVNAALARSGPIWQEESYDRIVRDEEHLWRCIQYVGRNPSRAGLPRECWRRWLHPTWLAAGWGFLDED